MGRTYDMPDGRLVNEKGVTVGYTPKAKRQHYTDVVRGNKPIKADSQFSSSEQIAYARGQMDARNEAAAAHIRKHGTEEQKQGLKAKNQSFFASRKAAKEAKQQAKTKKK